MSSAGLTEVESKINEVRNRLANLSHTFQCDDNTPAPLHYPASQHNNNNNNNNNIQQLSNTTTTHASYNREQPKTVLFERNINEESIAAAKIKPEEIIKKKTEINLKGNVESQGLSRLVDLAKREAVQRRASNNTSPVKLEKTQIEINKHIYCDTTPTQTSVPLHSTVSNKNILFSQRERFNNRNTSSNFTPRFSNEIETNFDPFQAVQARLREKLRKPMMYNNNNNNNNNNTPSSPDETTKSPSPNLQEIWQTNTTSSLNVEINNETHNIKEDSPITEARSETDVGTQKYSTESRSPSVTIATNTFQHIKERFSPVSKPVKSNSSRFSITKEEKQKQKQEEKPKQRIIPNPSYLQRQPSRPSTPRRGSVTSCSSFSQQQRSTPRRPNNNNNNNNNSRKSSPCRGVQAALPLKTTPNRIVLDVLTGAEVFALMRLRGVLVSRGDTGECDLPETRCHSIYLSPEEHKQLVELRANLQLHSSHVKNTVKKSNTSNGISNRKTAEKPVISRRPSPSLRTTSKW